MEERELMSENWQLPTEELEPMKISPADGRPLDEQGTLAHVFTPSPEEQLTLTLGPLLTEMACLRRDFETKVKYDESKERVIESLHRELQVHQQGLHFRVLQPVFIDLIALYDDIGKIIAWMETEIIPNSEQVTHHLRIFQETAEEILRRQGVETFTKEEDIFMPQKQRCVKVIPNSDTTLDKHIARRVRCGFLYEEKLLSYELVEIYKYKPVAE